MLRVCGKPHIKSVQNGKYPFSEGFQEAGVDVKTLEAICRGNNSAFGAQLKKFSSNSGTRLLKFLSGQEDFCEEEVVLK